MLELNFYQLLFLIGLGNAIILLISFTQIDRKYRKPAFYLGFFIVGYLLYQANFIIIPEVQRHISFVIPNFPVLLFLPAFLYFFVESVFNSNFKITGKYRLFLIPGIFDVIQQFSSWAFVLANPSGPAHDFLTGRGKFFIMEGLGIFFSVICLYFIFNKLYVSNLKKAATFKFYRFIIAGMLIILIRWIGFFSVDLFASGLYNYLFQYIFWFFDMGFLLFTGYKILVTPKLLKSDSGGFILPESKKTDQLSIRLQEILSEKKLYLNPNLSRKDLAEELGVNEVFVSSLLNEALQTSFYELINKYRVEEAIHLIQSGRLENITVEALAKEAGFNSKSTFNKIFKQETGTTPTRYRDQL